MAMISVGEAPEGHRWFREIFREQARYSPWHIGRIRPGTTWPIAGPAICGFLQTNVVKGTQETAAEVMDQEMNFCSVCLATYRAAIARR
jgi:hypothetical protein